MPHCTAERFMESDKPPLMGSMSESSAPSIAEGYVGERIEQLIADGRLITAQTRYGQGPRTATEAELKMAENADPMQMHF